MKLFKRNKRAERPIVHVEVRRDGACHTKFSGHGYELKLYAAGAITTICTALEKGTGGRIKKEEILERAQRILHGADEEISATDPVEADRVKGG